MREQEPYKKQDFEAPDLWRDYHACSLVQTVILFGSLLFFLLSLLSNAVSPSPSQDDGNSQGSSIFAGIVCLVVYLSMTCSSFCSRTFNSLRNTRSHTQTMSYLESMKRAQTFVEFQAEAFHEEVYYERDKEGRKERKTKRVVTWRRTEKREFSCVFDQSRPFLHLSEYDIPMINLISTTKILLSGPAQAWVQGRIAELHREASCHDYNHKVSHSYDIEGRIESILSVQDGSSSNQHLSQSYYWLATLLGLNWFYKMWYNTLTYRLKHEWVKYVSFEQFVYSYETDNLFARMLSIPMESVESQPNFDYPHQQEYVVPPHQY